MLKLAGLAACALNLAAPAPMSSTNEIGLRQVQIPDTGPEHKVNQMRHQTFWGRSLWCRN